MPGLITHYICGEACLNMLTPELRKKIEQYRQLYNVGTQGPDIFFYYLPGLIKKELKELGIKMHKYHFRRFITALIEHIDELSGDSKEANIAYLCGYLTHYVLDYHTHPYIYYRTGFRKKNNIRSMKHSVYHRNFETAIDVMMLKMMSSQKPADRKLWQMIAPKYSEAMKVASAVSKSISTTYDINCTRNHVYQAMKYMSLITRFLQSATGKRKKMMQFVEDLTIGENVVSSLIHAQQLDDQIDYLNVKESSWHMPWDNKKAYTDSFAHLYNKSIGISDDLIKSTFDYFDGKISKETLLDKIGNNSLASGADCDLDVEFLYSDNVYETK